VRPACPPSTRAPSQKSFDQVHVLRQRTDLRSERRTSTVAREAGLGLGPETSGSPLGSGAFILSLPKGRKRLPRTSNCRANSATVFSFFTAADAAFALNAGLGFRRPRFVIVSPDPRRSWPPSGKNSPWPPFEFAEQLLPLS
jgi:hypothetical protein